MANAPSKLEPHRQFIAVERRKKTTYRRIAELLAEKGVDATYNTIHAFVKVRSKPQRKVITMYEPDALPASPTSQETGETETPARAGTSGPNAPAVAAQRDAIRRLKQTKPGKRDSAKGLPSFREDAPLDRISDDEARRLREEL